MDTGLAVAGVILGVLGAIWLVIQLVTAGRGQFLKERNEELANAVDQMGAQLDRDRAECDRKIADQDTKIQAQDAKIELLTQAFADNVAQRVEDRLEASGWVPGGKP